MTLPPISDKYITERFLAVVEWLLPHETVFAHGHYGDYNFAVTEHDPNDRGGATKFGIDQNSHPTVNVSALNLEQAVLIYLHSYWLPARAGDCPDGYGEVMFDIRVNGGDGPRLLQAGLASIGCDIGAIDGIVGPRTKLAMVTAGKLGLRAFLQEREQRYHDIAQEHPSLYGEYLDGWLNRNHDLAKFVGVTNL